MAIFLNDVGKSLIIYDQLELSWPANNPLEEIHNFLETNNYKMLENMRQLLSRLINIEEVDSIEFGKADLDSIIQKYKSEFEQLVNYNLNTLIIFENLSNGVHHMYFSGNSIDQMGRNLSEVQEEQQFLRTAYLQIKNLKLFFEDNTHVQIKKGAELAYEAICLVISDVSRNVERIEEMREQYYGSGN